MKALCAFAGEAVPLAVNGKIQVYLPNCTILSQITDLLEKLVKLLLVGYWEISVVGTIGG